MRLAGSAGTDLADGLYHPPGPKARTSSSLFLSLRRKSWTRSRSASSRPPPSPSSPARSPRSRRAAPAPGPRWVLRPAVRGRRTPATPRHRQTGDDLPRSCTAPDARGQGRPASPASRPVTRRALVRAPRPSVRRCPSHWQIRRNATTAAGKLHPEYAFRAGVNGTPGKPRSPSSKAFPHLDD